VEEEDLVVLVAMLPVIMVVLVLNYPHHSETPQAQLVIQDLVELTGLLVAVEVALEVMVVVSLKMVDMVLVDHR
jgi:hypothetical protein|tara:strand:+ start:145 stop:366 length:222 start_codon:yes stop_codon:yes gene_type:complete